MKYFLKKVFFLIFLVVFNLEAYSQQKNIEIEGLIIDNFEIAIPYAAISIPDKYIGTTSNDEGRFLLLISTENLNDTIEVSTLGYKTYKIAIRDYLAKDSDTIILEEQVTELSGINILSDLEYVERSLKHLKKNTISKRHQLNLLYRRASVEDGQSRFFVEHHIKIIDEGPSGSLRKIQVDEGRKSADYRVVKMKQGKHSINYMLDHNPLRDGLNVEDYQWSRVGDSYYDGEDVLIIEGKSNKKTIRFYIGMDTYKIYKIENSQSKAVFVYKKNKEGKLYLSYHNRDFKTKRVPDEKLKKILRYANKPVPSHFKLAYRHEVFVLGIEENKKQFSVKNYGGFGTDMGDVEISYNEDFWQTFPFPPDTEFYLKIKSELESHYGVPLTTQFKFVNQK